MAPRSPGIKPYECTQCGSTTFEDVSVRRVRCAHCDSLFEVLGGEPVVTFLKGSNVTFGKHADVEIHGDVEVQAGADVHVDGKVAFKNGRTEREFRLKLIRTGQDPAAKR